MASDKLTTLFLYPLDASISRFARQDSHPSKFESPVSSFINHSFVLSLQRTYDKFVALRSDWRGISKTLETLYTIANRKSLRECRLNWKFTRLFVTHRTKGYEGVVWSGRDKNKRGVVKMRKDAFIVFALFLILFCDATSSECTQQASCICKLPDGHYYNLTGLADQLFVYFESLTFKYLFFLRKIQYNFFPNYKESKSTKMQFFRIKLMKKQIK